MHTADMGTGLNGFRYRYAYKPVNYRTFMRCECGWSGLPHYSIRARGKQKCHSPIEIAKAVGLDKKLPGLMAAIIEAARKPEGNA